MTENGVLVVVSGFAGAGKGTLMKNLISRYDNYSLSVSATSRHPRPGEEEGVSYFFKTREEFEEMIRNDEFLEYAEYVGNYYGTPRAFVEKMLQDGKRVVLEIEIQGAFQIKRKFPQALLIYVMPPSAEELMRRINGRGTETPEVIKSRMKRAVEEAEGIEHYDYIVINDNVEECTEMMHSIIESATYTPKRRSDFIDKIRKDLKELNKRA